MILKFKDIVYSDINSNMSRYLQSYANKPLFDKEDQIIIHGALLCIVPSNVDIPRNDIGMVDWDWLRQELNNPSIVKGKVSI